MTWQDITVYQFQLLSDLWTKSKSDDPETIFQTVGICFYKTDKELDSLTVTELNKLCGQLGFLKEPMQWEPAKHFDHSSGRRYRFVYDVRQIHAARYMEVKQYGASGMIPNLHRIAASMVIPQVQKRRSIFSKPEWVDASYDAAKHEQYAADVQEAPITAIHGSAVFFCKLFAHSILSLKDYLAETATTPEQKTQLEALLVDSWKYLAGSTTAHSSPSTNGSALSKRISSQLYNSSTI